MKKNGGGENFGEDESLMFLRGVGGFLGVLDGVARIYIGLLEWVIRRVWRWYGWGIGEC